MEATNERTVVVGFDGSPPSRHAVAWAAEAAVARGALLRIISCYEVPVEAPMLPVSGEATAGLVDGAVQCLGALVADVARRWPDLRVDDEVAAGPPAGVLSRAGAGAELLVIGASSRHGMAAFFLGSTARAVARKSPCPVVIVRAAPPPALCRVIVGVDGSPGDADTLRWAVDAAARNGATVLVVHCWTPSAHVADAPSDVDEIEATRLLDRSVEVARGYGGTDADQLLVMADARQELPALAGAGDLLVLGRPRHGALLSGLLGSVVNAVLERATVPVVVVPHPSTGG